MRASAAFLALALPLAGCGGPAEPVGSERAGLLFPLPDKKGSFEIVTAGAAAKGPRGARGKAGPGTILAYFYGPDGSTELAPAPTDVTVKVGVAETSPVVTLTPQARSADDKATPFASPPGKYPGGFRGVLNAKIDGAPVEVTFLIR